MKVTNFKNFQINKKSNNIILFILISFSVYTALIVGETWDESYEILRGKVTIEYLFSLGQIDNYISDRERNSNLYYSILYFLTNVFPNKYQIESSHLINLFFSISAIFGLGKICRELFNKQVGNIAFFLLFIFPIFFGHMAFNSKNTILAFSHVWIFYLILKYLKNQNDKDKSSKYILLIGILTSLATGIQFVFIGSLIPIVIFCFLEIFIYKKIINNIFSVKKLLIDLIKCFIIFYSLLILFWIDVHPNIISLPYTIISNMFSDDFWVGWSYNLINGNYYESSNVSKLYILVNLIYKSPEFILLLYLIFFYFMFTSKEFFKKNFSFFNYKLSLIILFLIFANLLPFFLNFPIYDGMRLFLWIIPYFCIIPALAIFYLLENFKNIKAKISLFISFSLFIYFLYNFFSITPYQYTYLNVFNGNKEKRYQKFENDYWGASIEELVKKSHFNENELIKLSTCGVNPKLAKKYLKKNGYINFVFVDAEKSDYLIMTNRTIFSENKISNCFDVYKGVDIFKVQRDKVSLSVIRKKI